MTYSDTSTNQLILNYIENREDFDTLKTQGLNANELYLVSNDTVFPVISINYIATETPKFSYTAENGITTDIITVANLKSSLGLSSVATDGSYTSLNNKPTINNIELNGNKTTADLGITLSYASDSITNKPSINGVTLTGAQTTKSLNINYSDLNGLPAIPSISSQYITGDTGAGLTSAGVDMALSNYTPKTRTVTGTGALQGGGQLTSDITISHNNAPTGLQTSAVKVGVDQYGHTCIGSSITAEDVGAVPIKYELVTSVANLDGSNTVIISNCSQNENIGFSTPPTFGKIISLYCIGANTNQITLTIANTLATSIFLNGSLLTENYNLQLNPQESKRIDFLIVNIDANTTCAFINII